MKTCPLCNTAFPNRQSNCPTDGAVLIESRELEPGTVIRGKYRILRLLGRGGMGTVYLAEHILLSRRRALKFISSDLSQDPRFLKRFRHEAQAAIELRHPNIVEVVDLDQAEDGSPYIAMEYVEGEDLRHALNSLTNCHPERTLSEAKGESKDLRLPFGAFPVERALAIARGIAQGLGAAHAKGIVHRDVKPENILLARTPTGEEIPKLLDFGIAAIKETATAISLTHGLILTPQYAAPEQWRGTAAEDLDGRADLYALGGVLYEMLTGQTPFHAHNTEGWMYQHLNEQPQPPSQLRPELANWPGLDALVLRLLAKDRESRPKDAAELAELLDTVLRRAPAARLATVAEPPRTPVLAPQRSGIMKWAAAVTLIVIAVGIWVAIRSLRSPAPNPVTLDFSKAVPIGNAGQPSSRPDVDKWEQYAVAWTDPATGLTWTEKDNGSNINWGQAAAYCRNLQIAGHSDWRLPTIDELQAIYDPHANVGVRNHVKGGLQISGVEWSSSPGDASGEALLFNFPDGKRFSTRYLDFSFLNRALCVRRSGE